MQTTYDGQCMYGNAIQITFTNNLKKKKNTYSKKRGFKCQSVF